MNPLNPIYAAIILSIAILTGYLINLKNKFVGSKARFETIDGLRGFLAVCVFISHTTVWHGYIQKGLWVLPKSNLFSQLGHASVAFFFMISSFLFFNRLLEFKGERFNWKSFYIKRIFRLVPLHFFIVLIILLIVFIQSDWVLNESISSILKSSTKLFAFTILGVDPINTVNTSIINAGVLWSLPYEWLLYFSLPIISLFILKNKPSIYILILSLAFIAFVHLFRSFLFQHILSFLGGMIAPLLLKFNKREINFNNHFFTLVLIVAIILIGQFRTPYDLYCKLSIIVAFTIIAMGNDLFGILKSNTLKFLGEVSYSTYLIHGVLLFIALNYIYGIEEVKSLSELQYSVLMFTISPFVILISFITYRYIERPFMKMGKHFNKVGQG